MEFGKKTKSGGRYRLGREINCFCSIEKEKGERDRRKEKEREMRGERALL